MLVPLLRFLGCFHSCFHTHHSPATCGCHKLSEEYPDINPSTKNVTLRACFGYLLIKKVSHNWDIDDADHGGAKLPFHRTICIRCCFASVDPLTYPTGLLPSDLRMFVTTYQVTLLHLLAPTQAYRNGHSWIEKLVLYRQQ